jgi:hypothetical protein
MDFPASIQLSQVELILFYHPLHLMSEVSISDILVEMEGEESVEEAKAEHWEG